MTLADPAILLRRGTPLPAGEPRTLIVLGAARGGTTMIAQMLRDLGVFMGENLNSTCQDSVMAEISRALFQGGIEIGDPIIQQVLRGRDRLFRVWGWKFPTHVFANLYTKARNPHLIVVFRDPVAIAARESISRGVSMLASFRRAQQQLAGFGNFVLSTAHPCLAVSFERGLARRHELVDELAGFAGIAPSSRARHDAAEQARPGTARYLDETRARTIEGAIDHVGRRIAGWLRYPLEAERKVRFTVMIDGVAAVDGVADRFRGDLAAGFDNGGYCAFEMPVPEHFIDGKRHRVSVAISDTADCLVDNNDLEWIIAGT
jgi:hypothetical protein